MALDAIDISTVKAATRLAAYLMTPLPHRKSGTRRRAGSFNGM
jgi:hypothetical protein